MEQVREHSIEYPLTDLSLARRLERAEGRANVAFVEARARVEPNVGATWMTVAGVFAMFDGVHSPLTQTFGLGVFEHVGDDEFARLEAFFRERGAPPAHEVCPLIAPDTLARLNGRGYRPAEFSTVLVRPTALPTAAANGVSAREIGPDERDLWSSIAGEGWSTESAEVGAFVEAFGRVVTRANGVHCFIAEKDGAAIAAGTLTLTDDVALLSGATTIPSGRNQGAQRALLDARLRYARAQGLALAMMVAAPGSASQRNAERQGFRIVYTRTKWQTTE